MILSLKIRSISKIFVFLLIQAGSEDLPVHFKMFQKFHDPLVWVEVLVRVEGDFVADNHPFLLNSLVPSEFHSDYPV